MEYETILKIVGFLFSYITSFIFFYLVFNKFKYSNNIILKIIQKFVVYGIVILFSSYIIACFSDYIYCGSDDDINNNKGGNKTWSKEIVDLSENKTKEGATYNITLDKESTDKFIKNMTDVSKKVIEWNMKQY